MIFFMSLSWIGLGLILFGVLFQWILFALLPKNYEFTMNIYLLLWVAFGYFLMGRISPDTKKPDH